MRLNEAPSKVASRFWSILVGIMVLAIAASSIAVWLTTTPFLREFQDGVIREQAEEHARIVETILEQDRQILAFIASQREIISVSMGYVNNPDVLADFLTGAALPANLSWLALYDAFGEPLARNEISPVSRDIFPEALKRQLAVAVADEKPDALSAVILKRAGTRAHLMIATPVTNKGYVEGALVGKLDIEVSEIFPANEIARSTRIVTLDEISESGPSADAHLTRAAVRNSNLAISIEPDREAVASAGRAVLMFTAGAIAAVLISAFSLFAWFGRAHIVAPHLRIEEQRRELSELAAVATRANDAIIITDLKEKILWCNPAFETLSGYTLAEARGNRPGPLLQGLETASDARNELRRSIDRKEPVKVEMVNYRKNGEKYWVSVSVSALSDSEDHVYGFMAVSNDITEARIQREQLIKSKKEIEHQALHDALTGLANRRAFDTALEARAAYGVENSTIVRIDLDHFKYVNDNMGHAAGDFVLCEVARILTEEVRSAKGDRFPDLPARVGGDEFVVLLSPKATSETAKKLSERLLERIRSPMTYEKKSIRVGASFGVASTSDGLLDPDELLAGADAALYEAKENGRNMVCLYTPVLHRSVVERRELARAIRRAVSEEEFEPWYQPQFDAQTLEIVGVETLARWPAEGFGILTPAEFFPVAEQLSLMEELDRIIFRKAANQICELRQSGITIQKVAFNVTAQRLVSGEAYRAIKDLETSEPKIAIEVLESVILEEQSDVFRFEIDRLRELGVLIEIDDFGSGHTSLVGIMELNPDVMKIDRRLVFPVTRSEQACSMLRQIVGMAKIMDLSVTAEGVETMEHARVLADLGCDCLQGFALARPMPLEALKEFAAHHNSELKARAS